jgi:hypothetical protein
MKKPALSLALVALLTTAYVDVFAQANKNSAAAATTLAAAQTASKANRWAECIAKAREAQGISGRNAYDDFIANELIGFCATRSNDFASAIKAYEANLATSFVDAKGVPARLKALLQLHYSNKGYAKVIEYGQRMIKEGSADADTYLLVAQTYYQQGDNKSTRDFVGKWIADQERRGQRPRENAIQMYVTACMRLKDEAYQLVCKCSGEKQAFKLRRCQIHPALEHTLEVSSKKGRVGLLCSLKINDWGCGEKQGIHATQLVDCIVKAKPSIDLLDP